MNPLLIVGHGTKDDDGVEQFMELVERVRKDAGRPVEGGFLELAAPPIQDAVNALAGASVIDVVPLVLVAAGHSKGDIPAALERERLRHPGLAFRYGRPLGPHPLLLEDLTARLAGQVPAELWPETAVVLVGRGATDPDANAEVAKTARLLLEGRGLGTVETAFVSLAEPSVTQGLDRAERLGYRRIVVLPYFLFEGVLPQRIRSQSEEWAKGRDVVVTVAELDRPVAEPRRTGGDQSRGARCRGHPDELRHLHVPHPDARLRGQGRAAADAARPPRRPDPQPCARGPPSLRTFASTGTRRSGPTCSTSRSTSAASSRHPG